MNVRQAALLARIGAWFNGPNGPESDVSARLDAYEERLKALESAKPRRGRPAKSESNVETE